MSGQLAIRFLAAGDGAVAVEFGDVVDRELSEHVLGLDAGVRAAKLPGLIESVPSFRSLLLHYDPLKTSAAEIEGAINKLLGHKNRKTRKASLWHLPACYDPEFAPDIDEVATRAGIDRNEIVRLHSSVRHHVYMIGFLPGCPYMGDLPDLFDLKRRIEPRLRVPQGSIAVASKLTVIYPLESPGGWHIIGATPIAMFDPGKNPPVLLTPGDSVMFEPVDAAEFARIRRANDAGRYRPARAEIAP